MNNTKTTMINIILVTVCVIIVLILLSSKKCVSMVNPENGQPSGECYHVWQKAWWGIHQVKEKGSFSVAGTLNECEILASQTEQMTARGDTYQAGEEAYYACLIRSGFDPAKFPYKGKVPSEETLEYIKATFELKQVKDWKDFFVIYPMTISYKEAEFLKTSYGATDVFIPNSEEQSKALGLFSQSINTAGYETSDYSASTKIIATDYHVQFIGMIVDGKRMMYAHAFSWSNVGVDPTKEFITEVVRDGGTSFIDAVVDLEKGTIIIRPHGEA